MVTPKPSQNYYVQEGNHEFEGFVIYRQFVSYWTFWTITIWIGCFTIWFVIHYLLFTIYFLGCYHYVNPQLATIEHYYGVFYSVSKPLLRPPKPNRVELTGRSASCVLGPKYFSWTKGPNLGTCEAALGDHDGTRGAETSWWLQVSSGPLSNHLQRIIIPCFILCRWVIASHTPKWVVHIPTCSQVD